MAFELKRASVEDAPLLAEMRLEMRRERETAVCTVSEDEFFRCNLAFFKTQIAAGRFVAFIAYEGDQAAACSGLSLEIHPPTYGNPGGKSGYVTNMYTRPAWRRRGLAALLLDRLAETARHEGCAALRLNASAMGKPVYLHYGFRPVEDEMVFDLSPAE